MSSYLNEFSTKKTPQSEPIPGENQVRNSAGGFSYEIDSFARLRRFLILGSEGGSYYASQRRLTRENANCVIECARLDGAHTVRLIEDISINGSAPKNDQAIFALALLSAVADERTRQLAFGVMPNVCRTGTHLFQFISFREQFGGWGRAAKRAVAEWYTEKEIDQVAYQVVKYRRREDWTHLDALRTGRPVLGIPEPNDDQYDHWMLFKWISGRYEGNYSDLPEIIQGFEAVQSARNAREVVKLVEKYRLPREALPTEYLNDPAVWESMLYHGGKHGMPITALIRNLATMTRIGLLRTGSRATTKVIEMITAQELLQHARVHPMAVLIAQRTYAAGFSLRGKNTWIAIPEVVDALDEAFYLAFDNVEPTGKRRLIALDISGSMWGGYVAGIPGFTPAEAAAAMAMVSMRSGDPYEVVAYADANKRVQRIHNGLISLPLSARQRLDDVNKVMDDVSPFMGDTDCALPLLYARDADKEFDVIESYTDSESWSGSIHPSQALRQYRKSHVEDARLIAVAMVANNYSIADPRDPGMLDVVGFDASAPAIMSQFISGNM